ncbi:MAG: GntR family transcriptional regulator [Lentisphaeria bacterium]|nr:GntR family transcriptional regulator [Lentisphaeria bacterium]
MFDVPQSTKACLYERIVDEVLTALRQKKLKIGDELPSINKMCKHYGCARETIVKSYKILKEQGVLESRHGKGYFVIHSPVFAKTKVCLILSNLNPYMTQTYRSFRQELKGKATVDVFFHHYNSNFMKTILEDVIGRFDLFVIKGMEGSKFINLLNLLPEGKTLLLDRRDGVDVIPNFICQDFYEDVLTSLKSLEKTGTYCGFNLLWPEKNIHPPETLAAFKSFAKQTKLPCEALTQLHTHIMQKGYLYLTTDDEQLVKILDLAEEQGMQVGKDIAVLSYNEEPIKKHVAGGISTLSIDFRNLGKIAAKAVLQNTIDVQHYELAKLTLRNSTQI